MNLQSNEGEKSERVSVDSLLQRALLLDLEVSHQGEILKLGALLGSLTLARSGRGSFDGIVKDLDRLAEGADFVLGHNLIPVVEVVCEGGSKA
jgi:hypothetical protein